MNKQFSLYLINTIQGFSQLTQITKTITTVGTQDFLDICLKNSAQGHGFSIMTNNSGVEILPGPVSQYRVRVNGLELKTKTTLRPGDRVEWGDLVAILITTAPAMTEEATGAANPLNNKRQKSPEEILQLLTSINQSFNQFFTDAESQQKTILQALKSLQEISGAEEVYLLNENASASKWIMQARVASANLDYTVPPSKQDLFSQSILNQAIQKRELVFVESLVGHELSTQDSILAAKLFSVACIPLIVGERITGAVFFFTRTVGHTLIRKQLPYAQLLANQLALILSLTSRFSQSTNDRKLELTNDAASMTPTDGIVSQSALMATVKDRITRFAGSELSILILGETGVGKELVAQQLHKQSDRKNGPFVAINCAAIPATLLESTLFGYERGAFTGATSAQTGKIREADGGTLFLDEIGDLPLELQAKLLRVLQERVVDSIGGKKSYPVDIRIVSATHQNLNDKINQKAFRHDLFYRLNGATIEVPPLRKRKEDVPLLAQYFLRNKSKNLTFAPAALSALEQHPWPGNVRELEQVVSRSVHLARGSVIEAAELELDKQNTPSGFEDDTNPNFFEEYDSLDTAQKQFTIKYVEHILKTHGDSRAEAAKRLKVSERTLYRIIDSAEELGIQL